MLNNLLMGHTRDYGSPVEIGGVVEEVGGAVEREGGDWEVGGTDADGGEGVADSAAARRNAVLIRAPSECILQESSTESRVC